MSQFIEQIYQNNGNFKGIIFLDRDGTLIEDVHYLSDKKQIKLLPTVVDGIRLLNSNKIAVVVITNQPVVARGYVTIEGLKEVNDELVEILKKENAFIDAIYSCPHHPERNHPDIPPFAMKYRIKCECRKPSVAMFKKAMSEFGAKKELGVIGNDSRDSQAGKKLGILVAVVRDDEVEADFVCNNFLDAVKALL